MTRSPADNPPIALSPTILDARLRIIERAERLTPELLEHFRRFLIEAQDEELFRASPFRVADQLGIDHHTGLDLFLHATFAGILEFTWGVLCPYCASFITTEGGLRALQNEARCNF